jgi:hypothetical protein
MLVTSSIHELRACDNGIHQRSEAIAIGSGYRSHTIDGWFIGEQEGTAERICEQFSAEIVDEILLAMLAYVGLHAFESGPFGAAGKNGACINRMSREVLGPPLSNGPVTFKRQTERIEARVTGGADRILPVFDQHVPQRQIQLRLIVG